MNNLRKPENLNLSDLKLLHDEKVVWTGQPELKVFGPMDRIRIPFYVLWLSVGIFAAFNAFQIGGTSQALQGGASFSWFGPLLSYLSEHGASLAP